MIQYCQSRTPLLLSLILLLLSSVALCAVDTDFVVRNLQVNDLPYDGGDGVEVSWSPIVPIIDGMAHPEKAGIIEYRVYRGVSPDTLFYVNSVPVNAKTGFTGEKMVFTDKGYGGFVDITSPLRLEKEDKQAEGSPIYGPYPRDLATVGPLFEHYAILGMLPMNDFYHKSREIEKDGETYAGLKIHQTRLLKKLLPNHRYYYTVIAVSQSRKYYPYAEPASGMARENAPELPREFESVYISDNNTMQFEWVSPIQSDDVGSTNIYMLNKSDIAAFDAFVAQNIEINELKVQKIWNADALVEMPADILTNPAVQIGADSGSRVIIDAKELGINADNSSDYVFLTSLQDYAGLETFGTYKETILITTADLPALPDFKVIDYPHDKGDINSLYWGKPVTFLTKVTFLNEAKDHILVNYDYNTSDFYKVRDIYFTVKDMAGNVVGKHREYYQDNRIWFRFDKNVNVMDGLTFEMTIITNKGKLGKDYVLNQKIAYNEKTMSMMPEKVFIGDESVNQYKYLIYKKRLTSGGFSESKKLTGIIRTQNENLSYDLNKYVSISMYDEAKGLLLLDPTANVGYDTESGTTIRTSIFASGAGQETVSLKERLTDLEAKLAAAADEDKATITVQIESTNKSIAIIENYAPLAAANKIKSNGSRMRKLAKNWSNLTRSEAYQLGKTDGKACFIIGETYTDESGNTYFLPVPNWFKGDRIPMLVGTLVFGLLVFYMVNKAKSGADLYIRPIAGIQEIDNAIGRATEMGRPILFQPGLSGIQDVATLAGLAILGRVAKKAAEYDTRIIVPVRDYIVLPIAQEIVKEAHYEAGRPDTYDKGSVFFITTAQFAFVAGVNGVMIREKTATNFYMGMFFAESLLMTETGNACGAIQIAGTDAVTQIPFFITTCDYTLIGEELYAASAYMAREPMMLGALKAQDYFKFLILLFIVGGTILSTMRLTFLINAFPDK